jgi:hypothetical protein|tara:strand:+ start:200 stop:466 length:267 start_codon:yes stop_codon:yes gene_type:complete
MLNYVSGYEYTGRNADVLAETGVDAVVTFKQAIRDLKVSGKKMKGIKKVATLIRYSKKETEIDPETGKEKPKAIFFSVFDVQDVLKRK